MARPPKNTEQLSGHRTKTELQSRKEMEDKLKTNDDLVSKAPNWLDKEGKKVYKFLIEQFELTGILCNLDINTLAICADAMSKMKQAQKLINEQGLIVNGKTSPAIIIYEKYEKIYMKTCSELGLSPSARSKMALTQAQNKEIEQDPILKLINGNNKK